MEQPNSWSAEAIRRVSADWTGAPTPLRRLVLVDEVEMLLKDESALPTGSLKYRLVRAMFCHAIASGAITAGTPVVAATSGAVGVAGARLACLLGLPFTAVVPERTAEGVLARIERAGGRWQAAVQPPAAVQQKAAVLARRWGGYVLDHFADAERAVAAADEPTIAEEIFGQPTSRRGRAARPTTAPACRPGSRASGGPASNPAPAGCDRPGDPRAGRRVDRRDAVASRRGGDRGRVGHRHQPVGVCHLAARMREEGAKGAIVTLVGDSAEPYLATHHDAGRVRTRGLDPAPYEAVIERFARTGEWQ